MKHNGLNMVRLAFQRSKFSGLHYVYLLLSSSFLALSAKCTIFFVVHSDYQYLESILLLIRKTNNPNTTYPIKTSIITMNCPIEDIGCISPYPSVVNVTIL